MKYSKPKAGSLHAEKIVIKPMAKDVWNNPTTKLHLFCHTICTPYGKMMAAVTGKAVCFMGLEMDNSLFMKEIHTIYPYAEVRFQKIKLHQKVQQFFTKNWEGIPRLTIYIPCTSFQWKVWNALLQIPTGCVCTYRNIAEKIGNKGAARATGNAISKNPILYLIPCHRVILSSGKIGGFHWGIGTKLKFLNAEAQHDRRIKGFAHWEPTFF